MILVGSVVLICGGMMVVVGMGVSFVKDKILPFAGCAVNLELAHEATMSYAEKTGKFPKKETWTDDIRKYVKLDKDEKGAPFKMWDGTGPVECSMGDRNLTLYYNEELSGGDLAKLKSQGSKILFTYGPHKEGSNHSTKLSDIQDSDAPNFFGNKEWIKITIDGETKGLDKKKGVRFGVGKKRQSSFGSSDEPEKSESPTPPTPPTPSKDVVKSGGE